MRLATAACMQKYGNVSFATVACAKCMRYGGGVGDHTIGGGGGVGIRDPDSYMGYAPKKTAELKHPETTYSPTIFSHQVETRKPRGESGGMLMIRTVTVEQKKLRNATLPEFLTSNRP